MVKETTIHIKGHGIIRGRHNQADRKKELAEGQKDSEARAARPVWTSVGVKLYIE